jgi:hypothetical protein
MQSENSFDKLSKRVAVAVSRRTLLRSLSLAAAGALLPWRTAFAQDKRPTSIDLETKFLVGPFVMDLHIAGKVQSRCIAAVTVKKSGAPAIGAASARKDGECPTGIANYFENSDLDAENARQSSFTESKLFNVKVVEGRSRLLYTYPAATSYSFVNPTTGKEEFDAYCSTFTYLDPRVHKGEPDLKMIHYKRMPTPEKLTSIEDDVTCGDINYAYENEIKTRKPIALRDFTVDAVPHQALADSQRPARTPNGNNASHRTHR